MINTNKSHKRDAFTLIELLVVISIIALLVSILLPSLTKAKDLARRTVCLTQLKASHIAVSYYANDNSGMIILSPNWGGYYSNPSALILMTMTEYITEAEGEKLFVCPSDPATFDLNKANGFVCSSYIGRYGMDVFASPTIPYVKLDDFNNKALYCDNFQNGNQYHSSSADRITVNCLKGDGSAFSHDDVTGIIPLETIIWADFGAYNQAFLDMD